MCGINGVLRKDRELVERMNAATAHRGPDGVGLYENAHVTLGHNRLAIIDTSSRAAQPMQSADGALVITYNGELFNYRELRALLPDYPWKSDSDTEVILAAYEKWGPGCLTRFNGIFAFALWDARAGHLVLARDPVGVNPLYYTFAGGELCFSSEIKALLEAGITRTLDPDAFSRFMRLTDVVGPDTLLKEVQKLPPGHYAIVKDGAVKLVGYWKLDLAQQEHVSPEVWQERIRTALDASVTRQLISDRPVGVYLSGGIDSSAVLASVVAAKGAARTYTTRFAVESKEDEEKFNRDALLARKTAEHFGAEHTEITLAREDVIALLEDATWHLDEPSGSATALSQLMLARKTVREVAVVLGGDGGDELFGGYERYRLSALMDLYQKLPQGLRAWLTLPALKKLNTPPGIARFALFYFTKEQDLKRVLASAWRKDTATPFFAERFFNDPNVPFLEALMDADRQLLTDGSLLRTNKLSMAAGLEARVPILDREMIELAARIPAKEKASLFTTKKLFKDALRGRLPAYLFSEPKRGWSAPASSWLAQADLHSYAKEVLSAAYYPPTAPLFDWAGITAILDEHYEGKRSHRALIWTLLSFQIWARRFAISL